jgi:RNA polymerase sigma-70 factor (ECF subfamily)
MADFELPDGLRDDLRAAWHRYIDLLAPLRPALHGYCRRLTGNLWDAEDLVQDTLLRSFATLGSMFGQVGNPRAYLLRTATNLWIDTVRRRASETTALAERSLRSSPPPMQRTPARCGMPVRSSSIAWRRRSGRRSC